MALPRRPIRRCLRLRAYRHSAVDGRAKSTFASFVIKNILRRERVFRAGGGMSAPDMQWEGFSGWNGLLGIWGLEPEWTARDRGEAARGRATGKGCSEWGTGRSGRGRGSERERDAWNRNRALGMGTGRPEWRWGFFGRTRGKLFEGPFEKCAKLWSVTTAQCDGRVVRERR